MPGATSESARPPAGQPADARAALAVAGGGQGDAMAHAPQEARDSQLAAWLAAAAAGDARAFEAFYEATFAYARTVARRLLRGNEEVEDLLSGCYFEAWRNANRFDATRGSAVTWLLTLVRSRGLDALRAAAARPRVAAADAAAAAGEFAVAEEAGAQAAAPSDTDDPAQRLWRRQAGARLHAALGTLSAPERWVLGLAYLRELSHSDIAHCTGMPLGTVKSHALRAQAKLREQFMAPALAPSPRIPS
jgi:RNA polymerase sigma-70 factor (ECF subfamily)